MRRLKWLLLGAGLLFARIALTAADHWALQPIASPPIPNVARPEWPRTAVDFFILHKLEHAGRSPAPEADRRTLIRRATLDLTGLPPTPDEVDAFVSDPAPNAFDRLIDRLLSSPRYGERWGRHWLDVARFADSNGMDENLAYASAFRYRDYVVHAFNRDIPYNQFVCEQIAGDLMPATSPDGDRSDALAATGFLTLGPKMLAEDDPVKMEMDIVDEQLDSTSRVLMGLTVGCARCHDHKYDPISMRDYYAMAGIFKSTRTMENFKVVARWQEVPIGPSVLVDRWHSGRKAIERQRKRINDITQHATDTWLANERRRAADYLLAATDANVAGPTLDSELLTQWQKYLSKTEKATNSIFERWHRFNTESSALPLRAGAPPTNSVAQPTPMFPRLHAAPLPATRRDLANRYRDHWLAAEEAWKTLIQSTNVPPAQPKPARLEDTELEAFREVLFSANGPFAPPKNVESRFPSQTTAELASARAELKTLEAQLPSLPEAMAVSEGTPANLRIHKRGSHWTLGDEVERGFPKFLSAPEPSAIAQSSSGRIEFARWLTDPRHPLTTRVLVNRIWHWHFGEGLVRSPDNFGALGEKPTHPELLDWLCNRFVASGWSIKALHRLLMTSAVYRQSASTSEPVPPGIAPDPDNRLLSHFSRRRLEVETIRDSLLYVGDGLDLTMGGTMLGIANRTYVTSTASKLDPALFDAPRRSVYLPVVRSAMYDVFQVFDFADPSVINGRRDQTVVAPQALFMMNSRLVAQAALRLAKTILSTSNVDDATRITRLYKIAFGRAPTASEIEAATHYLRAYAEKLESAPPHAIDGQLRAWQSLCRAMLASNEFIHLN